MSGAAGTSVQVVGDRAGPPPPEPVGLLDLEGQFDAISRLMYSISGVNLTDGKRELVKARLSKRMRVTGWSSVRDYIAFVQSGAGREELVRMVDALTTNKTSFFREEAHFDFLRHRILPDYGDPARPLRIWSAGCSSGEEPYTLAMVVSEALGDLPHRDVKILATDLSTRVLDQARAGIYSQDAVTGVLEGLRRKYFRRLPASGRGPARYQVADPLRAVVRVARLNLMERWPMAGPFDLIMCRNVMIYFDKDTRARLLHRFAELLPEGGHLMVGHSESLNSMRHELSYVQPAIYRK